MIFETIPAFEAPRAFSRILGRQVEGTEEEEEEEEEEDKIR